MVSVCGHATGIDLAIGDVGWSEPLHGAVRDVRRDSAHWCLSGNRPHCESDGHCAQFSALHGRGDWHIYRCAPCGHAAYRRAGCTACAAGGVAICPGQQGMAGLAAGSVVAGADRDWGCAHTLEGIGCERAMSQFFTVMRGPCLVLMRGSPRALQHGGFRRNLCVSGTAGLRDRLRSPGRAAGRQDSCRSRIPRRDDGSGRPCSRYGSVR